VPGAQRVETAGQSQMFASAVPEGHTGQADTGHERGGEVSRVKRDRRFAAELVLLEGCGGRKWQVLPEP
jgi:hypothetical protein